MNKNQILKKNLLNLLDFIFYFYKSNIQHFQNLDNEKIKYSTYSAIHNNLIKYKILNETTKDLFFDIFYSFLMNHYLINGNKRLAITFFYFSFLFFEKKELNFNKNFVINFRKQTHLLENNNQENKEKFKTFLLSNQKKFFLNFNFSTYFKELNNYFISTPQFKKLKKIILQLQTT